MYYKKDIESYLKNSNPEVCVFCEIIKSGKCIAQTKNIIVLPNLYPINKHLLEDTFYKMYLNHFLIIPRLHYIDQHSLNWDHPKIAEEMSIVMEMSHRVVKKYYYENQEEYRHLKSRMSKNRRIGIELNKLEKEEEATFNHIIERPFENKHSAKSVYHVHGQIGQREISSTVKREKIHYTKNIAQVVIDNLKIIELTYNEDYEIWKQKFSQQISFLKN